MFFVPQRRALSRHQNFYKCSEVEVFCTFLTWKCASRHNGVHFFDISTFKHILNPSFFTPLTSKCASRHNGVQFFISHLASWLRTRRFSEPTFRPSGGTNHWKNAMFRDFPTFSRTWMFFDLLSSSLLFSDSSHLCFSSVHIVGSFTSKLPSTIFVIILSLLSLLVIVCFCSFFCFLFQD